MSKKAGITALKRVIEAELVKKTKVENERRSEERKKVGKEIDEWVHDHTLLAGLPLKGAILSVDHVLKDSNGMYTYRYSKPDHTKATAKLTFDSSKSQGVSGHLDQELILPNPLASRIPKVVELTFHDLTKEAELLASRVLIKGEGGDIEKTISEVVDAWIKEQTA